MNVEASQSELEISLAIAAEEPQFSELPLAVVEELEALAGEAQRLGSEAFGLDLDGTAGSLENLENILGQLAAHIAEHQLDLKSERMQDVVAVFSAYLGELLRKEQRANWRLGRIEGRGQPCLTLPGSIRLTLFPMRRIADRLLRGPQFSVVAVYTAIVKLVQQT